MANFSASSGAFSRGYSLDWTLDFDDAANTVTVTVVYGRPAGSPDADPQAAKMTLTLNSSVQITLDFLTARLSTGQLFDGSAAPMLNAGARTRSGVKLKVSADRAALITHSTEFLPPA